MIKRLIYKKYFTKKGFLHACPLKISYKLLERLFLNCPSISVTYIFLVSLTAVVPQSVL